MKPRNRKLRKKNATGNSLLPEQPLPGRARHSVRADFLNKRRRAEDCPPYQSDRPQVRSPDGFVLRRTGGDSVKLKKKRPRNFAGRFRRLD